MAGPSRTSGQTGNKPESTGGSTSGATSELKNKAQETAHKAQDVASNVAQKAQDTASQATQKAQEMASNLGQKAQDMASTASQKADDALSSVGDTITSLAGTLRQNAPHEGAMGTAASAVADRLQAGGHYLQEHGMQDMTDDLQALVRRFPVQSVLVGLGVGFLLGQACSRR